jgi:translation elongation factor EF-1beta
MSNVGILFKIFAEDNKTDELMVRIKETLAPKSMGTEELAFGIKIIKAFFEFDDSKTSSSSLEASIKAIKGVSEVEVLEESLIGQ